MTGDKELQPLTVLRSRRALWSERTWGHPWPHVRYRTLARRAKTRTKAFRQGSPLRGTWQLDTGQGGAGILRYRPEG
jgi:hypothetical protein